MVQLKFAMGKANASDGKWIKSSVDNLPGHNGQNSSNETNLMSYFLRLWADVHQIGTHACIWDWE